MMASKQVLQAVGTPTVMMDALTVKTTNATALGMLAALDRSVAGTVGTRVALVSIGYFEALLAVWLVMVCALRMKQGRGQWGKLRPW